MTSGSTHGTTPRSDRCASVVGRLAGLSARRGVSISGWSGVVDPNETLRRLREAAAEFVKRDEADVVNPADMYALGSQVVDAAADLDEWLSRGGFLPADWARGRS